MKGTILLLPPQDNNLILQPVEIPEEVFIQKILADIISCVTFPSPEENTLRQEALELLNSIYLKEKRPSLIDLINAKELPKNSLSAIPCALNLADQQYYSDRQEYQTVTRKGIDDRRQQNFYDYMRVFILLMECLKNKKANFNRVFNDLCRVPLHVSKNARLKSLGNYQNYNRSFYKFQHCSHFIMAIEFLRFICQMPPNQQETFGCKTDPNDELTFLRWCIYFKKALLALRRTNTKNTTLLLEDKLAPVNMESLVDFSDDDFLRMDAQRQQLWGLIRYRILLQDDLVKKNSKVTKNHP